MEEMNLPDVSGKISVRNATLHHHSLAVGWFHGGRWMVGGSGVVLHPLDLVFHNACAVGKLLS